MNEYINSNQRTVSEDELVLLFTVYSRILFGNHRSLLDRVVCHSISTFFNISLSQQSRRQFMNN